MNYSGKRNQLCMKALKFLNETLHEDSHGYLDISLDAYFAKNLPEGYVASLKRFKTLFSSDDPDIKIALWNEICFGLMSNGLPPKDDFSDEEYAFLKECFEAGKENYWGDKNINATIMTNRLILRPALKKDLQMCARHLKEEEDFFTCFGLKPTRENIKCVSSAFAGACRLNFAIEEKNTHSVVGFVYLRVYSPATAELEYYVFKEYRRNGYCKEAVSVLTEKALRGKLFEVKETVLNAVWNKKPAKIDLIRAQIPEINESALNAIRSCGFVHEGTLHRSIAAGKNQYINKEIFYKAKDL